MKSLITAFVIFLGVSKNAQTQKAHSQPLSPIIVKRLDSLVHAYEQLGLSGNVLISQKNMIVYQRSYGKGNLQTNAPIVPGSLFAIESLGKMFTASMIIQLVEEGRLDLNVPINTYLPDSIYGLPLMNIVTIHHLLTHTSGYERSPEKTSSVKIMSDVRLSFPMPGSKALYSNVGYVVLGEIIARVTGISFIQNISTRILKRAGIKHFYSNASEINSDANLALPYKFYSKTKYRLVKENLSKTAGPAGGWLTTIDDLYHFNSAYRNYKLFSKLKWEVIRTANHTMDPKPVNQAIFTYGLNWLPLGLVGSHMIYGHSGGGLCYSSALYFEPASDFTVITLSNTEQPSREPVANYFNVLNNEPLLRVDFPAEYKLMSLIDEKGVDYFSRNYQQLLSNLTGKDKPEFFVFTKLIDNFIEFQSYQTILSIVEIANHYYPGNAIWNYFKADAYYNLKDYAHANAELKLGLDSVGNNLMAKQYLDDLAIKLKSVPWN